MLLYLLFLSVFYSNPPASPVPEAYSKASASNQEFTAYLEKRVGSLMQHYNIPGAAVAIIDNRQIIWTKAFGYANLETGRKMTLDTYFRMESISKPVTAWGVMNLVEERMIELDSPVRKYIQKWEFPESNYSWGEVTVGQLLSHRSGLPLGNISGRYAPESDVPGLRQSLSEEARLVRKPGTSFIYSNTGYNLLELLIEEVTGRNFAEYMETEILKPLGMQYSTFKWNAAIKSDIAKGYTTKGAVVADHVYAGKASGGLFSTIGDIASFVAAGLFYQDGSSQDVLNPKTIRQLYSPVTGPPGLYGLVFDAYGLGHFIEDLPNGQRAVSHGGQGYGWMTHFHSIPGTGDALVILTNSQRSWPFFGYLLGDWTAWKAYPTIGMQKIVPATRFLWVLIAFLFVVTLGQISRVLYGIKTGHREYISLMKGYRWTRSLQIGSAMILLGFLYWAMKQNYLFLVSVFPSASGWLGLASFGLALSLIVSAIFPTRDRKITPGNNPKFDFK